jgi:hypothetical protein
LSFREGERAFRHKDSGTILMHSGWKWRYRKERY